MHKGIFIALLGLIAVNLLPASSLRWDRTEVQLEMEPEQKEVRATFTVTNDGDERIRIARIDTSCGCTGSIVERKILNPGESTKIIGTFNKGKRQGLNRNRLEVFIDSQPDAVAVLRMNVNIPKLVEAMPQIVYWSPGSTKSERTVRITLDKRYVDTITKIEYDEAKLNVVDEPDPDGKATRLLKITPKSYDELYRGTVKVLAKGKDGRTAEAKIHTLVQP